MMCVLYYGVLLNGRSWQLNTSDLVEALQTRAKLGPGLRHDTMKLLDAYSEQYYSQPAVETAQKLSLGPYGLCARRNA